MISVCMAVYNGEKYIREQVASILCQLSDEDELIVSDDHSKDSTLEIIRSFGDDRIRIYTNNKSAGVAHNFENALIHSKGDILFFADQDDVWYPNKIKTMCDFLLQGDYDVISCNCSLTDPDLNVVIEKYYTDQCPIDKSAWGNLCKDLWLGCCMAFKRAVLEAALPLPPKVAAHDLWLALFSQLHFKCGYCPEVLQLYRRHDNTVSFAGKGKSKNKLSYKISYRLYVAYHLLTRRLMK